MRAEAPVLLQTNEFWLVSPLLIGIIVVSYKIINGTQTEIVPLLPYGIT
jgi:hypothetical protein